jgi:endonuclease/exonuclease/phosphatase family metal-dependent hydrolase
MQSLRRIALVALLIAGLDSTVLGGTASIVTWNMQWFPGGKPTSTPEGRVLQMSRAKEALLKIRPDILCVQEMRNWEAFEELVSVVPLVEPLVVSEHRDNRSGGAISIQQIGIASKFPTLGAWSEAFQASPDTPPRGFSFVVLDVGDGKKLMIYSVHLKSNLGEKEDNIKRRQDGARQVLEHAKKMQELYAPVLATIVCGDFNVDPSEEEWKDDKTFQAFFDAGFVWPWTNVPKAARVTHPGDGRFPPATFDGFLIKGNISVNSCVPIPIDSVSDHRPVELVIDWP